MAQTFNPDHVLLKDTLGQDIKFGGFSNEVAKGLKKESLAIKLGERVDMGNQYIKRMEGDIGELSDAYIVGEGEKIGTAGFDISPGYTLETKKISVILPATYEALQYSWSDYFTDIQGHIIDKFSKTIDAGTFFGLYKGAESNPFGSNVLAAATEAGNVQEGDKTVESLFDLESLTDVDPTTYFGHRGGERELRGIVDEVAQDRIFDKEAGRLNGLNYEEIVLPNSDTYPEGALIVGDPKGIKFGLPVGSGLRLMVANQATLSKIQNVSPDTGDFHLFEQDSMALRAIFEIAIAVPNGNKFAVLQPAGAGV